MSTSFDKNIMSTQVSRRSFIGIAGIASLGVAAILAGCSSSSQSSSSNSSSSSASTGSTSSSSASTASSAASSASASGLGNVLVAYYSATGNTERVAERIAADTNGTLFEIMPTEPYSADDLNWNNANSRVSTEHDNPDNRDVPLSQTTPDNWDSYDTVFVGYPIWWGEAAWPVNRFASDNNFSGKRVITFCTSSSSSIGTTTSDLSDRAGTGNWENGQRFGESGNDSSVDSWISRL